MNKKEFAKRIVHFIKTVNGTIYCIVRMIIQEDFKRYINKENGLGDLYVLANGPSLKQSLVKILEEKLYEQGDVITVNFMVNEESFYVIKPKYHVITDPMFYKGFGQVERVENFFKSINTRVDWDLTLFVNYKFCKVKGWKERINNEHIKIVPLHRITPPDDPNVILFFAKRGIFGADYGSVLHHAINVGIMKGYKRLLVYGADHTFFDGLCVDENNRVCKKTTHFYNESEEIKPIFHTYSGKNVPYTMSFFLWEYQRVFRGHEILRMVSEKMGTEIINKTPVSLIDSYKRQ